PLCPRRPWPSGSPPPPQSAPPREQPHAGRGPPPAEPSAPFGSPCPDRQALLHQGRNLLQGPDTFPPQGEAVPLPPEPPQQQGIARVAADRRAHGIGLEQVHRPAPVPFLQHRRGGLEAAQ